MGRGTVGGAEVARGTSCKHGSIDYDGKERDTNTEGENHSYDLRFKLRAVAAAKNSIITAAVC